MSFENPIHTYRRAIKHHGHISRTDADKQRDRQAAATAKHEAETQEREQYLASLVVKESEPASDEPLLQSRFRPRFKQETGKRTTIDRTRIKAAVKKLNERNKITETKK